MQDELDATQGAPIGDAAPPPATEQAPGTGTEQTSSTTEQTSNPEPKEEAEAEKPKQTPWFQRRIDELTRDRWEKQRENERLSAELQQLRKPPQPGQQQQEQPRAPSQSDIDRMATQRAQQMTQEAEFNRNCNEVFEKGTKAFPDFEASLANFRMLGGLPPALVEAAVESGEPARVLYELGRNPDEASRILALTPTRMAVAVAKMASRPPAPQPVSKAPPPIKGIGTSSKVETDPDKMSTPEWKAWREKQLSS